MIMIFLLVTPWQVTYAQQEFESEVTGDTETEKDLEDGLKVETTDEEEATEEESDVDLEKSLMTDELNEAEQKDEKITNIQPASIEKYTIGDEGEHVAELKRKLVQLGFASWSDPSERYGPITAGVVKEFQKH